MQKREQEQELIEVPVDPKSEEIVPVPVSSVIIQDDDPDEIFLKAVAEIDTQPLLKKKKFVFIRFIDVLQVFLCSSLIIGSIAGIVWQVITYPKTLVILYAVEKPAHLTATLDIPTRTLAPVTLTRSLTTPTTGHGHQDERTAIGILTFYNGSASPQTMAIGTVFTGLDGIHISTDQSVAIPAANPPYLGQATITATTLQGGSTSNIHSYDINQTVSSSVFVKNLQAFTGGKDARIYKTVAQQDIQHTTSTLQATIAQAIPLAFPAATGENVFPTHCVRSNMLSNQPGDEASTVTVKVTQTCSAVAYRQSQLQEVATQAFTAQTKPGTHYKLVGSLQSTVVSVTPFTVRLNGSWVYVLSQDYEQYLAQQIAGDTPQQARAYLIKTGGISEATIPSILPQATYIKFLVLMG